MIDFLPGSLYNGTAVFIRYLKPSFSTVLNGILSLAIINRIAFAILADFSPPSENTILFIKKEDVNEIGCSRTLGWDKRKKNWEIKKWPALKSLILDPL